MPQNTGIETRPIDHEAGVLNTDCDGLYCLQPECHFKSVTRLAACGATLLEEKMIFGLTVFWGTALLYWVGGSGLSREPSVLVFKGRNTMKVYRSGYINTDDSVTGDRLSERVSARTGCVFVK